MSTERDFQRHWCTAHGYRRCNMRPTWSSQRTYIPALAHIHTHTHETHSHSQKRNRSRALRRTAPPLSLQARTDSHTEGKTEGEGRVGVFHSHLKCNELRPSATKNFGSLSSKGGEKRVCSRLGSHTPPHAPHAWAGGPVQRAKQFTSAARVRETAAHDGTKPSSIPLYSSSCLKHWSICAVCAPDVFPFPHHLPHS